MKIAEKVKLSELTTMRLGGEARYVIDVEDMEDVEWAFNFAEERGLAVWMMGAGANTIAHDAGFPGVVIKNAIRGMRWEGDCLEAGGGEKWDDVVRFSTKEGYSGIEAMAAIPGTAGAAPVQNIGAYGQDIAQSLVSVLAYDRFVGEAREIPAEEMKMGYRSSIFNTGPNAGRYFIISICLQLKKGATLMPPFYTSLQNYVDEHGVKDFSPENIRKMVSEIRAGKLPDPAVEASAGSFFKNVYLTDAEADDAEAKGVLVWREKSEHAPSARVNKVNSGWLIQEAGLSGKEFYGFKVSEKAALILINKSAKSYDDLTKARAKICRVVKEKFGYTLEQEPVEIPSGGGAE